MVGYKYVSVVKICYDRDLGLYLGCALSVWGQSKRAPAYSFPLHVTFTTNVPVTNNLDSVRPDSDNRKVTVWDFPILYVQNNISDFFKCVLCSEAWRLANGFAAEHILIILHSFHGRR